MYSGLAWLRDVIEAEFKNVFKFKIFLRNVAQSYREFSSVDFASAADADGKAAASLASLRWQTGTFSISCSTLSRALPK